MLHFLFRYFCRLLLYISGWSFHVHPGYTNKNKQIVLYPHTSIWDFIIGGVLLKYARNIENVKIIVWQGHFKGIKGWLLKKFGCIPIDNNTKNGATKTISNILNKNEKFKFCISPEGTREKTERFRSGFFYIRQNTGAVYNVCSLDFQNHKINFGNLIESTGDLKEDCQKIEKAFVEGGLPLHPEKTNYIKNRGYTSVVNWLCLTSFPYLFSGIILYRSGFKYFGFLSFCCFLTSFFHHKYREKDYILLEFTAQMSFLFSLVVFKWKSSTVLWRILITLIIWSYFGIERLHKNKFFYVKQKIGYTILSGIIPPFLLLFSRS